MVRARLRLLPTLRLGPRAPGAATGGAILWALLRRRLLTLAAVRASLRAVPGISSTCSSMGSGWARKGLREGEG